MAWQDEWKNTITTMEELRKVIPMTDEEYALIGEEAGKFPMSISRYYASLIDPSDPDDPIRKMSVPSRSGLSLDGELDTSGEHSNTVLQGIQHKYRQTALVLMTTQCAMYCRYCFRRRMVGLDLEKPADDPDALAAYLKERPEITNCLLSGGDALLQPTERLAKWLDTLADVPQLDFIRIGSRTPVTFPCRITDDRSLLDLFSRIGKRKQLYLITHFNHPREVSEQAVAAVRLLIGSGVIVKNQTVLLKGVNDDPEVLALLLRKMTATGVVQHYIFQCRPVVGATNYFQVPLIEGSRIVNAANALQNGLGKSADYTMSHKTGKIRILGETGEGELMFQYKQAKDPSQIGKLFTRKMKDGQAWL